MDEIRILRTYSFPGRPFSLYIWDKIKMPGLSMINNWKLKNLLLYKRWPWHVLFWSGYILFRFWPYYITVKYYPGIYVEYMLLSEIIFIATVYVTLWLYRRMFHAKKHLLYFSAGAAGWLLYLYGSTAFQFYYLRDDPNFKGNNFISIFLGNVMFVLVYFLVITSCKYFKDGYITQKFEAEKKQQHLLAEVNNLKSQIAPHFLFNTLNNLYGLAVDKSDKLPDLMLRLSDLLRHSLYEAQKPLVSINEEINVLKSYINLESIRLEDDLKLEFDNRVSANATYEVAPLVLIVFIENAFKHARLAQSDGINIYIKTTLENDWFNLIIRNNYYKGTGSSANGIGLTNVKRRLEVLYPDQQHHLSFVKDENFYTVNLQLHLKSANNAGNGD